jgi:carbonic anhydrase/acetyltransferase-like protein (isoleucine patch superfamily)
VGVLVSEVSAGSAGGVVPILFHFFKELHATKAVVGLKIGIRGGRQSRSPLESDGGFLVSRGSGCYLGIFALHWRILLLQLYHGPAITYGEFEGTLSREPDIRAYKGKWPQIAASAYIDPAAVIIGDVTVGEDSSFWPLTVARGDVHSIRIGNRTNIQDGCVLHVMKDQYPLVLGDEVTVGHSVTLHGCTIESRVLIGMRATILNGAVIGANSIIAAGTLITERSVIPAGSLVMGSPGKVKRGLTAADIESIGMYATRYAGYGKVYRAEAEERGEQIDWSREKG